MTGSSSGSEAYPTRAIFLGVLLHYGAYIIMQTLALFAQTRPGPTLPDLVLDQFAAQRQFDWINSAVWLPLLLLSITTLGFLRPRACVNYLRAGAVVSVLRGVFIVMTSLGPPEVLRSHTPALFLNFSPSDITLQLLLRQWLPLDMFLGGSGLSAAYLTQDLFFSGHTASTFLLLLVVRGRERFYLFEVFLVYHVVTVFFLFVTHEHYTIDVLGAYFIVYAVYRFMERRGWLMANQAGAT